MKLNTLSLSLSFICTLLFVSCGGRQERDNLYELLRDFESRPFGRYGRSYKLACFDENSVDSVFITLDITKADGEDSVSIRLVDGTPYLSVGSSEPVPPPPPPMPVPLTDDIDELQSLGIGPEQYVDNKSEEEKELEWLEWQKKYTASARQPWTSLWPLFAGNDL